MEAMKIVRLTSLLPNMPRLSSPNPRLRYGRRLAHLSVQMLTLNLCILSFVLSLAFLPHLSPLLIPQLFLFREAASVFVDYLRSHFSVSQPKALRNKARVYLPTSTEPRVLRGLIRVFASPFRLLNFSRLPQTSPRPLLLAQTKFPIPC